MSKPRQIAGSQRQDAHQYPCSEKRHLGTPSKLNSKPMSAMDAWWQYQAELAKGQTVADVKDWSHKVLSQSMQSSSCR